MNNPNKQFKKPAGSNSDYIIDSKQEADSTDNNNSEHTEVDEDRARGSKRLSLAVFVILAALVLAVTFATAAVEHFGGKNAGTVFLVVIAIVVAITLYRKEIASFLRKEGKDAHKDK